MIQEEVPRWLRNQGRGWITAEYSLLPASTGDRVEREASRGKQQGRTVEIQRLIGRAVRAVADFRALGERTMWLDCDVLQADGGTRCAAICGAYVAGTPRARPLRARRRRSSDSVAAVSVGVVGRRAAARPRLPEDSNADTDMNVVMTGDGRLVEVQATAERDPFTRERLDELLALADGRHRARSPGAAEAVAVALRLASSPPSPSLAWPHVLLRLSRRRGARRRDRVRARAARAAGGAAHAPRRLRRRGAVHARAARLTRFTEFGTHARSTRRGSRRRS